MKPFKVSNFTKYRPCTELVIFNNYVYFDYFSTFGKKGKSLD